MAIEVRYRGVQEVGSVVVQEDNLPKRKQKLSRHGFRVSGDVATKNVLRIEFKPQPCTRCSGTGELPGYRHVLGGICFRCWGIGLEMAIEERNALAIANRSHGGM